MSGKQLVSTELPMLLRAEEVARLLSLGRSTVFALMKSGELPSVRIGRAVRVPREAIDEFVATRMSGRYPTTESCSVPPRW